MNIMHVESYSHPWTLIGYKLAFFPFLNIIFKLPIPYAVKMRYKKKFFYDKFALFSREKLKDNSKERNGLSPAIYELGLFQICIIPEQESFSMNNLEWNLAYEFFDIIYPALNPNYFRFILGEGPYENEYVFIEKGDFVLDAGANLGIFSFLASRKTGDNGHVFCLEPIRYFIRCIQESIIANRTTNISLLEMALGRDNRDDVIYLDSEHPGNSGTYIKTGRSLEIKQKNLDTLVLDEKVIPRIDFIKMDIEGSERETLLGARETIYTFKPKLSLCTYHLKDDPIVLPKIIKSIDPNYKIKLGRKKLYAKV